MSSFEIRQWYEVHAPRYFHEFGPGDWFWQPKYYCFHVYSAAKIQAKLEVYVSGLLNRDEFREHCDRHRTSRAILANLR